MDYSKSRLSWLFHRYHTNTCTPEEQDEFLELVANAENDEELQQLLSDIIEKHKAEKEMDDDAADRIFNKVVAKAKQPNTTTTVSRSLFRKLAVAASIAVIIGAALYATLFLGKPKENAAIATYEKRENNNDIRPGGNKAVLTLADGSQIILDTANSGLLTHQGNVKIEKLGNGQLAYNTTGSTPDAEQYNSVSTPRGGQYKLTLGDGTAVWLNSASSIRYPIAFYGNTREVEVAGEVYFEVAKNMSKPFVVKKVNSSTSITVLGTHFNVNAYDDDTDIKVTLLEGAVQVASASNQTILKPGQQASIANENIKIANHVDTDEVMAWKNGKFDFGEKATIQDVMRQLARWYDLEVEYKEKVTTNFWGTISRDVNASEIFKMLEATGGVKFKVEGKKVIVMR